METIYDREISTRRYIEKNRQWRYIDDILPWSKHGLGSQHKHWVWSMCGRFNQSSKISFCFAIKGIQTSNKTFILPLELVCPLLNIMHQTYIYSKSEYINKIFKKYLKEQINYNYLIIKWKKSHLNDCQKYKNYYDNFLHSVFNIINRLIKYLKIVHISSFILYHLIQLH